MNKTLLSSATGAALILAAVGAQSAPPADWNTVKATEITLFYPGTSAVEWITKGTEHGGARALKKGETCVDCHSEEIANMGQLIVGGKKLEPTPIAGKAPSIDVKVQAAHDGHNLYLRFTWAQPKASGAVKMDADNPIKIAYMLEAGGKAELAQAGGCWGACHGDARTMPGAIDSRTKYIKGGSLVDGIFYDLNQWRSGQNKAYDGHIATERVMEGGQALVGAQGKLQGDTWTVQFTRKFAGGAGDVPLEPGKTYNFGLAIHDDNSAGRYHHVSLGYHLGIDAAADITADRQ
ncbi:MAG TPA: ethylbenzene dehydrogenase-related protein [Bordetella sp.]|nr:ethylbenzene dehydrogenase-related protein [Bordetella sp.]